MKDMYKIELSNGKSTVSFNKNLGSNVRFNPKNIKYKVSLASKTDIEKELIRRNEIKIHFDNANAGLKCNILTSAKLFYRYASK